MSPKSPVAIQHTKLQELEYRIMPGRLPSGSLHLRHHDALYIFWRELWSAFYLQAKTQEQLRADEFLRADAVAGLFHRDEPVGVHLYTFFNLDSQAAREHSYWQSYSELDVARLRQRGVNKVMSMEFFAIRPEWRRDVVGLSLPEVLGGCGLRLFEETDAQAVVTIARKDVGVHVMSARYGFEILSADQERHHHPVDLVAVFKGQIKAHPIQEIRHYTNLYWQKRQDSTGLTRDPGPSP